LEYLRVDGIICNTELVIKQTGRNNANLITVALESEKLRAAASAVTGVLGPEMSGKFLNR